MGSGSSLRTPSSGRKTSSSCASDGTGLRRLTDDAFRDRGPVWSPDGKEIAFYSNRTDTYGIWAVKPDGSGLRPVTERSGGNEQNLLYPVFSPAGDRLVASRLRANETIAVDPRREWKAQTPDVLQMTVSADRGWSRRRGRPTAAGSWAPWSTPPDRPLPWACTTSPRGPRAR